MDVCISWPSALSLALTPSPGPQFVFTGPGPQFVFTGPGPQFAFSDPGPQFVFTSPGPQFIFIGFGLQFYYQPELEFAYTDHVSAICICIYGTGLQFVLPIRGNK